MMFLFELFTIRMTTAARFSFGRIFIGLGYTQSLAVRPYRRQDVGR